MTYRALELLNLPPDQPSYLLDIGCGSGLSGEILDEEGFIWAGVDIAPSMLGVHIHTVSGCDSFDSWFNSITEVSLEREVNGDLFLQDIGQGFGFRPGSFDGAIRFVLHLLRSYSIIYFFQHFCSAVAAQRRNVTSHIFSTPPLKSLFHHITFSHAESFARCDAILSFIG